MPVKTVTTKLTSYDDLVEVIEELLELITEDWDDEIEKEVIEDGVVGHARSVLEKVYERSKDD